MLKKDKPIFIVLFTCTMFFTNVSCKPTTGPKPEAPKEYIITYVLNGGTNDTSNPSKYKATDLPITLKASSRDEYIFNGWYEKEDFSGDAVTQIAADTTGDKTFYAKWTEIEYTITYELNGGTNASENPAKYKSSTLPLTLEAPIREGYVFVNWYETKDFSGEAGTEIKAGTKGNKTLYSRWTTKIDYTVNYYKIDDGTTLSYETPETGISNETSHALISLPVAETGYTYKGWYTDEACTGNAVIEIPRGTEENEHSLYAIKTANTYTVKFNANLGTGSMPPQTLTYDKDATLSANTFTRTNWKFVGWNSNADGSGTSYTDEQSVKNLKSEEGDTFDLYAMWELLHNITVKFPQKSDINVTKTESGTIVTFAADTGYTNYNWYVYTNKTLKTEHTGRTFEFDTADCNPDFYEILLIATKDGEEYSAQLSVTIN